MKLLILKQPIINLFGSFKCTKVKYTKIPILVKLMKIIFNLSLIMFFNVLHLEQKYFRKKYEYFNNKYNLRYIHLAQTISLNERLLYGFKNTIISGLISFLICFIIQCIINYFIFKEEIYFDKNNENNDNYYLSDKDNKKYIIFFGITFIIMIIIFYSMIAFNEVYRGGFSDLLSASIWTFVFLQISPFIFLLIIL